jgi:hypothetical protein
MARFGVRSSSPAFARSGEGAANKPFERTNANGRERLLALAMQKVVGSSPIIRSSRSPRKRGFSVARAGDARSSVVTKWSRSGLFGYRCCRRSFASRAPTGSVPWIDLALPSADRRYAPQRPFIRRCVLHHPVPRPFVLNVAAGVEAELRDELRALGPRARRSTRPCGRSARTESLDESRLELLAFEESREVACICDFVAGDAALIDRYGRCRARTMDQRGGRSNEGCLTSTGWPSRLVPQSVGGEKEQH